jgi:hypothetical protein
MITHTRARARYMRGLAGPPQRGGGTVAGGLGSALGGGGVPGGGGTSLDWGAVDVPGT